jgi:Ca-activated chloride channel homolog
MMKRRLQFLAIFFMGGTLTTTAQEVIFSVAAEEVRVDVLVTDRGKPVSGLSTDDFEVYDNGVKQEVRYAKLQKLTPISATLLFDMSRSVAGERLTHLRVAARGLLSDLREGDSAALIAFNNAVILGAPPTQDLSRVNQALEQLQPIGNSALIDGAYAGLILAESRPDPPLLIIFSDGRDTFSWLTGEAVLETATLNEAVIYAVSTEKLPEKGFLTELTKITGGSAFEVESTRDLASAFLSILEEFRQRYIVTYIPQGVSEDGYHNLDVRVKKGSAKVRSRPGYMRANIKQ